MSHDENRSGESNPLDQSADPRDQAAEPSAEAGDAGVASSGAQLAELTDRYLRLAAEYDNFRKRTGKERGQLWAKAQADLLSHLVDALDDLTRVARVDPVRIDVQTLLEGVDLVGRKVWKQLEGVGVRRVDQVGVPFDPNVHDAVTTAPAPDASQDHTVGAILQTGYMLGELLIRPARVQVLTWQGDADAGEGTRDR